MFYSLYVNAYDLMDQVKVSTTLYLMPDNPEEAKRLALSRSTMVQGEGESDPSEWARSALIAALESL